MKTIGLMISFLGCLSLYLSHPNQAILATYLPKTFRYLGWGLYLLGLVLLLYSLSILVAMLMWLAIATVAWSFLPFIPLLKRYIPHESEK